MHMRMHVFILLMAVAQTTHAMSIPVKEVTNATQALRVGSARVDLLRVRREDVNNTTTSDDDVDSLAPSRAPTMIVPPDFLETVETIKHENWTAVAVQLEDPANRSYVVGLAMMFSLGIALYGHKLIKLWLFLGGFFSVSIAFYLWAPQFIDTNVCCGPETFKAHVIISLALGVLAGGLALWVLKIGVFLCGTCLGLGISISSRSFLAELHVLQTDESFAIFYIVCAAIGGLAALYKEKPIIILVTSLGGVFGFFLGVGYFDDCDFLRVLRFAELEVAGRSNSTELQQMPSCVVTLAMLYIVIAVIATIVQCQLVDCTTANDYKGSASSRDRETFDDDSQMRDIELKQMLLDNFMRKEAKRMWKKQKPSKKSSGSRPTVVIDSSSDYEEPPESQRSFKKLKPRARRKGSSALIPKRRRGYRPVAVNDVDTSSDDNL